MQDPEIDKSGTEKTEPKKTQDAILSQQWLGYELHDGLLQWIVGARMHLDAAVLDCQDPDLQRRLKQSMRFVELAMDEGRDLIRFLEDQAIAVTRDFPSLMRQFVKAMRPLTDQCKQEIEFVLPETPWPKLPRATLWNLLRITQQAARNSIQHAGPAQIRIVLGWDDSTHLKVVISDNGIGFEQATDQEADAALLHFGLSSMRHRARLIDAALSVEASPRNGCRITVIVPI